MKKKVRNEIQEATQLKLHEKEGILIGMYRGYNVAIGTQDTSNDITYITIPFKSPEGYDKEKITVFLEELRKNNKRITVAQYEDYRININYFPKIYSRNQSSEIIAIINDIIYFLQFNRLEKGCECCGENKEINPVLLNGIAFLSCFNCKVDLKNGIAIEQQEILKAPDNIIGGIVGSMLGALVGTILWIILYQLGYLAAIAGLVIAICSVKGYQMFGGKLNKKGVIITSIITLLGVYVAQFLSFAVLIFMDNRVMDMSIFRAIEMVTFYLKSKEISSVFWRELGLGYFFTVIGSISFVIKAYRVSNFKIDVKDLNI